MQRRQFLKTLTTPVALAPVALFSSGCGSIMYSDRVGQPHTHQIDWKVAAFNGLGMLFFFVPGVVAFAVDFYTGAIYLPYDEAYPAHQVPTPAASPTPDWSPNPSPGTTPEGLPTPPPVLAPPMQQTSNGGSGSDFRQVHIPRNQLNSQTLEHIVSNHTGQPICLEDQHTRLSVLHELDSFQQQHERHEADHHFGSTVRGFFDRLRNV
ncbi:hypothetical protein [Bremerella alba]|uniref:Lipoprotein n=1 Tax=Bremerella alba TaxID=980252 RepID=A0A7V8V3C5_9BACT|nr:hypothetical protein [Bremerella alba]MBA2114179.1 hypothetical protein [Bremerella alba]